MPVANVVDGRKCGRYNVNVSVVFESSWHDNSIPGSTQFEELEILDDECTAEYIRATTIDLAIRYAASKWPRLPVTMFLYDDRTHENYYDYDCLMEKDGKIVAVKFNEDEDV